MIEQGLKAKTVQGTFWSAADAFLGQGVTFLVGIILARILSPDEYGLIGICLIFNTVLNGIIDSGFSNALIRKKEVEDIDYNTMFYTNMVISFILYLLLFISSPYIASFFRREELTSLLRVTGIVLILNGLTLVQQTILTKNIDFKSKTKASAVSSILSGIVGIVMAYCGLGVWSLVAQIVLRQLLYSLSIWIINKWLPRKVFSVDSFKYQWGFGWKLLVSGLLNNIWNQLNQIVVGRFYSPASLGQFTRSRQFAALFSENFTGVIQRVSYPALAQIQDEEERLIAAYRRIIKLTMFVTIIVMFSLAAISEPFIITVLGAQWHEAATYLPLICGEMCLYPLHAINLNMLQVQGRSDIFLFLEIIKKILAIIPICMGIFISIYWMLAASVIVGIICFFLNSWYTGRKLHYSSFCQIRDILPSFIIGLTIAIPVFFLKYLPIESSAIVLLLQLVLTAIVFFLVCKLTNNNEYKEIRAIALSFVNK